MRHLALVLTIVLGLCHGAAAETRAAFVVGNGVYDHAAALENPLRDAALVAETLAGLGFSVERVDNATREELTTAFGAFLEAHGDADVTLLYYAGHGLQFEGRNYLVGRDARLRSTFDIEAEAVPLDRLVSMMRANSRAALVFVDACRDNPLADAFYRENFSPTRALMTRGLAPVRGSDGTMQVFAASPGQVAYDGATGNSPFATALARHLPTANAEVLSLMKRVIRDVKADTGGRQVPIVTNDLTADIFLNLSLDGEGAAMALRQQETVFEAALAIGTGRGWDIFLSRHPDGPFADLARAERDRLLAAEAATGPAAGATRRGRRDAPREVAGNEAGEAAGSAEAGLSSADARQVQRALNERGYDAGPVDGAIGPRTRVAVADFQLAVGLPSTGIVTRATTEALGLAPERAESGGFAVASRNARSYDPAQLALIEDDPRLLAAVEALKGKDIIYGYYEDRLYVAVQMWAFLDLDAATDLAARAGGYLATLTDAQENRFAYELVRHDRRFWQQHTDGRSTFFGPSFGLVQAQGSLEPKGGWGWVTREAAGFQNWSPGEPSNSNGNEAFASFMFDRWPHTYDLDFATAETWGDLPHIGKSIIIEIE